jgi:hypothetical protein
MSPFKNLLNGWVMGTFILIAGIYRIIKTMISLVQLTGVVAITTIPFLFGRTVGGYVVLKVNDWSRIPK